MVTVTIGSDSRSLQEADAQWVTREVNGRRRDGEAVCVRVGIATGDVHVTLSDIPTPARGWNQSPSMPQRSGGDRSIRSVARYF